ncbi:MAG: VOC family protein [Deltaproteobacteria bacterium]|nr:VOC family protein [Deltaproteobacteria bacterium]
MPFMYCEDAGAAADFYKKVFEATELHRAVEHGRASHVQLAIGNTRVMLSDATMPHVAESIAKGYVRTPHQLPGTPLHLYLYVPDADAAFQRAIDSGSEMVHPVEDEPWGDRCGGVRDPFGHIWYIATPLKDVRR